LLSTPRLLRAMAVRGSTKLRQLLKQRNGEALFVPGCFNALTAKVLEKAGFDCIYMTGYGTSLALLGLPDAGYASMTEMQLNARYIANAVEVPVLADADNGYGNAINVHRCIREYIQTGVAGVHLEDQVIPKRCGHVAGKTLVSLEEAAGKIRAAAEVRDHYDPDFLVIARTDAKGAGLGLDEALKRAEAFLEAGADMAFVEGPETVEEVERVCRALPPGSMFYNQTGVSPKFSQQQLTDLGVAIAIAPNTMTRCAVTACYDLAVKLKEDPLQEGVFNDAISEHACADIHAFSGFAKVRELEDRYLPADQLEQKYANATHGWRAEDPADSKKAM